MRARCKRNESAIGFIATTTVLGVNNTFPSVFGKDIHLLSIRYYSVIYSPAARSFSTCQKNSVLLCY